MNQVSNHVEEDIVVVRIDRLTGHATVVSNTPDLLMISVDFQGGDFQIEDFPRCDRCGHPFLAAASCFSCFVPRPEAGSSCAAPATIISSGEIETATAAADSDVPVRQAAAAEQKKRARSPTSWSEKPRAEVPVTVEEQGHGEEENCRQKILKKLMQNTEMLFSSAPFVSVDLEGNINPNTMWDPRTFTANEVRIITVNTATTIPAEQAILRRCRRPLCSGMSVWEARQWWWPEEIAKVIALAEKRGGKKRRFRDAVKVLLTNPAPAAALTTSAPSATIAVQP